MCWSLIYRKLRGNRGCTTITEYEYKDLKVKLENKNNTLLANNQSLTYHTLSNIIELHNNNFTYTGKKNSLSIKDRMLYKAKNYNAFEVHLQAYLMQNFDDTILNSLLFKFSNIKGWIGNEVSCGVGMQKIDIMTIQETDTDIFIKIIELKYAEPSTDILKSHLPWYINWTVQYIAPNYLHLNKNIYITPCIIAKNTNNDIFLNEVKIFSENFKLTTNTVILEDCEFIEFKITANNIFFNKKI